MSDLILDILQNRIGSGSYKRVTSGGPKGSEWAGPCPVCGGDDRFRVWPEQEGGEAARRANVVGTWWCRQCDNRGDLIELLVFAKNLSFVEACKELRIELSGAARRPRALQAPALTPEWTPTTWPLPSEKWRNAATKLALEAQEALLTHESVQKYLAGRGLPMDAAQRYGLGFLTADDKNNRGRYRHRSVFDLPEETQGDKVKKTIWISRGLTIPMWGPGDDGGENVVRLRIRRLAADIEEGGQKFMMLKGSCQAPMILPPTSVAADRAVWVIVEAELCAMAVHHACQGRVGVMAALTNRGKADVVAHKFLAAAPMILVALDADPADEKGNRPGFQGWKWWQETYPQAKRWPVPLGKDPGEAVAKGVDLAVWISDALPKRPAKINVGNSGEPQTVMPTTGGEGESKAVYAQAEVEPSPKSCPYGISGFEFILVDWDGKRKVYPVCYLDKQEGQLVELGKCQSCSSKPDGLGRLIREKRKGSQK